MRKVPTDPGQPPRGKPGAKKATGPRRQPTAASKTQSNQQALAEARKPVESGPAKIVATLVDPFGFRRFEDVFDRRVACALDRIGLPAPDVLISLIEEIEALRRRVEQLEKARR